MLYSLSLFNERQEAFFIGLFKSHKKARQEAEHYLSSIPGFRDYPCTYEITEKTVIGKIGPCGKVHMIWGWDEDEGGNEADIWSSDCYADWADAQRALAVARRQLNRQEWSLDTYRVLFGSSPQNRNVSYQEHRKYQSFAAVGKSPEAILSVMLEDWIKYMRKPCNPGS